MSYKDQTFCQDWCANGECFRNYAHIREELKEGGFLKQNPRMPISFFVDVPLDCDKRIPKNV